jgi:3-dehydroquinate dehydratase-2
VKKLLIVHGPNLNLLGKREPHIYGTRTLTDLNEMIRDKAHDLKVEVTVFQSNSEGELIDFLQKEGPGTTGIVINPGALSHYSLALYDCLQALRLPVVEVHISNIHARDELHRHSKLSAVVKGVIAGLGPYGYIVAMQAALQGADKLPASLPAAMRVGPR